MFLFTTPTATASPSPVAADPITDAIRRGANATGTDFDYLLRTAKRESSLNPTAKAPTSSATGLFQFIEQTWLGVVKNEGGRLGLSAEADAIVARQDGTFAVPDASARDAILKLREQPDVAAAVAGALTRRNRGALATATGREPTGGELYLAHVLGARGAANLINTVRSTPDRAAATDFPDAARANRAIFYDRAGRARSAGEVYAALTAGQASGSSAATASGAATPVTFVVTDKPPPGLQGLFQTGARRGPLSDAVARIWRSHGEVASKRTAAASFFPRSDASDVADASPGNADTSDGPVVLAEAALPDAAPLPPVRPSFSAAAIARSSSAGRAATRVSRP